jgi:predicted CoA-binding protein
MTTTKKSIDEFLAQSTFAVVGVSRNKDKFGSSLYREMKAKGMTVYGVNPKMDRVEGDLCFAGLGAIPQKPAAVVAVVQPEVTLATIDEMSAQGIRHLWIQPGAGSAVAVKKARELGMNVISGECLFMYLKDPESIHRFHRFFKRLFGAMPK